MTDQHFYYIGTVLAGAGMWEKQNILTASLSHILCFHHCHWSKPQAQNRKKPKQYSKISPSSHLACHCPCKQWTSKHLCVVHISSSCWFRCLFAATGAELFMQPNSFCRVVFLMWNTAQGWDSQELKSVSASDSVGFCQIRMCFLCQNTVCLELYCDQLCYILWLI